MIKAILDGVVAAFNDAKIKATAAYPAAELCDAESIVAVAVKSMRVYSSGLGSYIGVCTENGEVKELYGEKAETVLSLDIYCPGESDDGCTALADKVRRALYSAEGISVTEFDFGLPAYDADSRMFRSKSTARAVACLVREKRGRRLGAYSIGEGNV